MSVSDKKSSSKKERNIKIIEEYAANTPIKDLVNTHNLTKQSIYTILKKSGELPKNPPRSKDELSRRNNDIVSAYKSGTPMTELAEIYDLTRQGIQLILKSNGLTAKSGGAAVRSKERQLKNNRDKIENRDTNCLSKWGCTYEQWKELRDVHQNFHLTPIARYIQHRSNVKRDNITWDISLWDWWNIWNESGKYTSRGRGKNGFCMTRKEDKGSYTKDNVYITTISENLKDGFKSRGGKNKKK